MYFESTQGFKMRPADVKKEEHFCSKWKTLHLYRLESGDAGTYLAFNLHYRPHYQYDVKDRERIKREAKMKGINYKFSNKSKFERKDNLYHYTDDSKEYQKHVKPLLDRIADMMLDAHNHERRNQSENREQEM